MNAIVRSALVATIVLWSGADRARSAEDKLIVQTADLTPALIVAIAKLGREKTVSLSKGSDILRAIADNCGTANARRYYLPIFIQANSQNADVREGRTFLSSDATLVFPACLYAQEKLATVEAKDNIIDWSKATPTTPGALAEAIRKSTSTDTGLEKVQLTTKWPSTIVASAYLEKSDAPLGPSQSIGFEKLQQGWTDFSEALAKQGPSIVGQVSSDRLSDAAANDSYNSVLNAALSTTSGKVDPNVNRKVQGFERILRAQDVLASNEPVDFKNLPNKTNLVVSTLSPTAYAVELKDGVDARAAAKQIFAALPPSNSSGVGSFGTFTPYFDEPTGGGGQSCPEGESSRWPVNMSELKKVLELRRLIGRKPSGGRLLIFDTGFPSGKVGTLPFDRSYFIPNTDGDGQNTDPYLWSSSRPPVYFISGAKNAGHGVGVLALALGGIGVLTEDRLIASNASADGGMVVDLMGYRRLADGTLDVDTPAVLRTLSGDNWGQTDVASVNLSLKFNVNQYEAPLNFNGFFNDLPQVLFVVAAGNDGGSADDFMPARWGGTSKRNVITVGAVSSTDQWWSKSNQSPDHVDLAAPGCGVPTFNWDGTSFTKVVVNGTSFSAPLVSFAANLLQEYASGARRKNRILSTGRYSQDLVGKTRSARILDIPTALATPFDVVRNGDGTIRLGHITLSPGATLCGRSLTRAAFAQIHRTSDVKLNVVRRDGPPVSADVSFVPCDLQNGQLTDIPFREASSDQNGSITLKPTESLNMRALQSITFCDSCYWN
jgi:hypothetical protein